MPRKVHKPSTLHRSLHLQHHRHTGRKLAHAHTSYRGLALVLLVAGLSMLGLNMMARATADSLYVYARNPAPIPTQPAIITSPSSGLVTKEASVTITGTCPTITPRVIIVISDNGNDAGSVACDTSDQFSIPITLTAGLNTIIAKTYTITNDPGPDSEPITIRYDAPVPPAVQTPGKPSQTPPPSTASTATPLSLTIDEPFIVFGPEKDAVWTGSLTGGVAPYRVRIDWGDGSVRLYTVSTPGAQTFIHHYKSMRSHAINIRASSSDGQFIIRHYAAVTPYTPPLSGLGTTPNTPWNGSLPFGLYGAYLLLIALFGFIWVRRHPFVYAKVPVHHRYSPVKKRKPSHAR